MTRDEAHKLGYDLTGFPTLCSAVHYCADMRRNGYTCAFVVDITHDFIVWFVAHKKAAMRTAWQEYNRRVNARSTG